MSTDMIQIGLDRANAKLQERRAPIPKADGFDILVEVGAVSVNPVDYKVRLKRKERPAEFDVLGWDAVGRVASVGSAVSGLQVGDRVFYAGDISRAGSNAQFQLVDSRIVALAPKNLSDADAAAIPLTALTAYEALFDRLQIAAMETGKSLLVIGGAGGVGSLAIQLGKLAGLRVVATASRAESRDWCLKLGADEVVDHQALKSVTESYDYIFNTQDTEGYWAETASLVKAGGKIASIVETKAPVDLSPLFAKSASFHWELMFTRPLFKPADLDRQGRILKHVAQLLETGALKATAGENVGRINAANLEAAHERVAARKVIGKLVLSGW